MLSTVTHRPDSYRGLAGAASHGADYAPYRFKRDGAGTQAPPPFSISMPAQIISHPPRFSGAYLTTLPLKPQKRRNILNLTPYQN